MIYKKDPEDTNEYVYCGKCKMLLGTFGTRREESIDEKGNGYVSFAKMSGLICECGVNHTIYN